MRSLTARTRILMVVVAVVVVGAGAYALTRHAPEPPADSGAEAPYLPALEEPSASAEATATAAESTASTDAKAPTGGSAGEAASRALGGAAGGAEGGTSSSGSSAGQPDDAKPAWDGGSISDPKRVLSLAERKECFWKLIEAEYRAIEEAEAAYPMEVDDADYDAHYAMRFKLTDEYQAAVGLAYDLTYDGVVAVLVEGYENQWPVPPVSE